MGEMCFIQFLFHSSQRLNDEDEVSFILRSAGAEHYIPITKKNEITIDKLYQFMPADFAEVSFCWTFRHVSAWYAKSHVQLLCSSAEGLLIVLLDRPDKKSKWCGTSL